MCCKYSSFSIKIWSNIVYPLTYEPLHRLVGDHFCLFWQLLTVTITFLLGILIKLYYSMENKRGIY